MRKNCNKWRSSFKNNNDVTVRRRQGETLDELLKRFEIKMIKVGKSPKLPQDRTFKKAKKKKRRRK